ncbi:MAG: hypothetical protein SFY32_13340 [Bacteroidota bacterium]|nr:hypothetical protein [Bacteroidota bacterium]
MGKKISNNNVIPGNMHVSNVHFQKFLPSALAAHPVNNGNEINIAIANGSNGNASIRKKDLFENCM